MLIKRVADVLLASVALAVLAPLLALVGLAIVIEGGRPVIYRSRRAGRGGECMTVYKFRTMSQGADAASKISAYADPRVTRVGHVLRSLKVDELPQLVNVIQGRMSIVGPRPEDVEIVAAHYAPEHMETLKLRPGLASPGSIFNYTHGEQSLDGEDYQTRYLAEILPLKLALERYYVHNRCTSYDLRIIGRTLMSIFMVGVIKRQPSQPPEMAEAVARYKVPVRQDGKPART